MRREVLIGGRVIDPAREHDGLADVVIEDGRVRACEAHRSAADAYGDAERIDVSGLWVVPGLVDLQVQLGYPGLEERESLRAGLRAAVSGGFTRVCALPDTQPCLDHAGAVLDLLARSSAVGGARVHAWGALCTGLTGERLAPHGELKDAGVVGLSHGAAGVTDAAVLRRALEYAATFELTVAHAPTVVGGNTTFDMHESPMSARLGLRGTPAALEAANVLRDSELARIAGVKLHVAGVSTEATLRVLEAGRAHRHERLSAAVSMHHLLFSDVDLRDYDTSLKLSPPVRDARDKQALVEAIASGLIDAIVSDHQPWPERAKRCPFPHAEFGASALETVVPLGLELVHRGSLTPLQLFGALTYRPAGILGLEAGTLRPGAPADIAVIDPESAWSVTAELLESQGKNTPLLGREVRGRVVGVWIDGRNVLQRWHAKPT